MGHLNSLGIYIFAFLCFSREVQTEAAASVLNFWRHQLELRLFKVKPVKCS